MVTDDVQDLGPDPVPAMSLTRAAKTFGHVVALADGTVEIRAGEIHALVSENRAGKSTVVKLLAGLDHSDAGGSAAAESWWRSVTSQTARRR